MAKTYIAAPERASLKKLRSLDLKTDYRALAAEVGDSLSKYKPATKPVWKKIFPSQTPAERRKQYLKSRQERKPYSKRYGSVRIKLLFPALGEALGISEANARMRYYRGQVPEEVLVGVQQRLGITPIPVGK